VSLSTLAANHSADRRRADVDIDGSVLLLLVRPVVGALLDRREEEDDDGEATSNDFTATDDNTASGGGGEWIQLGSTIPPSAQQLERAFTIRLLAAVRGKNAGNLTFKHNNDHAEFDYSAVPKPNSEFLTLGKGKVGRALPERRRGAHLPFEGVCKNSEFWRTFGCFLFVLFASPPGHTVGPTTTNEGSERVFPPNEVPYEVSMIKKVMLSGKNSTKHGFWSLCRHFKPNLHNF